MPKSKAGRAALRLARAVALAYALAVILGFLMQRRLLYHPERISLDFGLTVAKPAGFEPWHDASGQFVGWKRIDPSPGTHSQLLIVHGNAGSAIDRLDYADNLLRVAAFDVYILEYPGYGARGGSPSQPSFFAAADQALDLLKSGGPLYIYGESIGTGVAAYLAGTHPDIVRGILLQAPYHNLTEVAKFHMPFLPVKWLLRDKYPSASHLEKYHGPVAVILAGNDEIIPHRFGRHLYDAYQGPKKLWEFPQATHNDLLPRSDGWWRELFEFWTASSSNTFPNSR